MIDPETSNAIQKQMLDKMEHYRGLLRFVKNHLEGGRCTASMCLHYINQELSLNPEYEVLEHLPHGVVPYGAEWNKAINTRPKPDNHSIHTKPCPNCGNGVVYTVSSPGHPWCAQCPKCGFKGPKSESAEAADKAWNEITCVTDKVWD